MSGRAEETTGFMCDDAPGSALTLIDEEGRAVALLAVNKVNIGLDVVPVACVTNVASVDIAGLVAHCAWEDGGRK